MARCLVTGHRGYIGSHLYKKLQELGHEVQGLDLFDGQDILEILKEYNPPMERKFHPHFLNFKPEYIFHLACIPRVAYSIERPIATMRNNVLSTSYVLNFARCVGAKRFIYSSSSSVVGNGDGPTSPYGLQKLTSEIECRLYAELYGVDTVSLRYFNVYSEDQTPDGPYATAICNWMQAIRDGKAPFITGDGEQRRDMLHVADAVSANIFAMERKEAFDGDPYDVGTGNNISLNEVSGIVQEHFPQVKFDYVDPRPGDVMWTRAGTYATLLSSLGWTPNVPIADGINSCFTKLKMEL